MKIIVLFVCLAISGMIVETIGARLKRASGGKTIPIEQAPYFVSLRRNNTHVCSGAFIGRRNVLTAAHCIVDDFYEPLYDTRVVSGTDEINRSEEGQAIKKIVPHDDYRHESFSYDIAVITLWMHVEWNERRQKIALPSTEPWNDMRATFAGLQSRVSNHRESDLKQLSVKIQYSKKPFFSRRIFYGSVGKYQSTEKEDSGGPLEYNNQIVGIAAQMLEGHTHGRIFVNVVKFKTFIETFIRTERPPSSERPSVILWAPKRPRL